MSEPILKVSGVVKSFPGVQAVRDGRLELRTGEVLALLGENGAGKSTLIKVLTGVHAPEAGRLELEGREIRFQTPHEAQRAGLAVIYQEFNLVPALSARENIFLGLEQSKAGFIDQGWERAEARRLLDLLEAGLDPETPCRDLTVAQQQMVEIAKALAQDARIIIMDEPTAALSGREVDKLFGIIGELKQRGVGIIFVSHRLDEVFRICDRATVMRDGAHIATEPVAGLSRERLIELMVGRTLEMEFPPRRSRPGGERLRVEQLFRGRAVRGVSFSVRAGEIVGLAGLVGAGRTEVARLLFGADARDGGRIILDGREVEIRSPRDAIGHGICLLTEDRKSQGLVLGLPARENFGLPNLGRFSRWGWLRGNEESSSFLRYVRSLDIKLSYPDQLARTLSGGNQQKVVLAKWLEANSKVVIFDEPTRGIDVGAKYEIYLLMQRLAEEGKAVLMISSELPEILGLSDRVLVMRAGELRGEITAVGKASQADIMSLAT